MTSDYRDRLQLQPGKDDTTATMTIPNYSASESVDGLNDAPTEAGCAVVTDVMTDEARDAIRAELAPGASEERLHVLLPSPTMMIDQLTLLAEFQIRTAAVTREEWLQVWDVRAQDALDHELETLAYGSTVPADYDDRVMIFERYEFGDQSLERHMERPAHERLLTEMTARNMTRRRVSLAWLRELPNWGCWSPDDEAVADLDRMTLTVTGVALADQSSRDRFVEESRQIANDDLASCEGICILGIGELLRPDTGAPEVRVGDLVIVEAGLSDDARQPRDWRDLRDAVAGYRRSYQPVAGGYLWR